MRKTISFRSFFLFGGFLLMATGSWAAVPAEQAGGKVPDQPLSLEDCVRIALETSPIQQAAEKGVQSAKEAIGQARAPYYPELGFQARYAHWQQRAFLPSGLSLPGRPTPTLIGPTDDWLLGVKLRLTLYDFGERRAQYRLALARAEATEAERAKAVQDLVLGVFQGFYGAAAAIEGLKVAEKNLARMEDHLRLARERKEAGAVSKVDVLRVEVEKAQAELARVRAEEMVRWALGNLNTWMGRPADQPLQLLSAGSEEFLSETPDFLPALERALKNRPELKAAQKRMEAFNQGVAVVQSTFAPRMKIEGSYGRRDTEFFPAEAEWLMALSLEWPLFNGFYRKHRLQQARLELEKEEAEFRQLLLKVRQEVWSAHGKLIETRKAVQASGKALELAEEGLRLARERYRAGAGTITDLLDAQNALVRTQAARLEAVWDHQVAQAVFQRAVGEINKPYQRP